jgi:RNA polymerase sigma-70 factor (ECF subfamily)
MARTWGRWTSVRDPHAYAFLVATNLARRAWKDRQGQAKMTARLAAEVASHRPPTDHSMLELIDRLPPKLRLPVLLHYYADLPAERVAHILRRPAGTIRQRLHEARRLLANMLKDT